MAKRSANNQKGNVAQSSDVTMTYSQYWHWFTSDHISDVERKETFKYLLSADIFSGMPDAAKMEVLEFAPDYILKYLVKVEQITQEFVDRLKSGQGTVEIGTVRPMTYKELVAAYKR